ncbi:MAG: UDP-3-O-acyl-N-acetylglucosamine deacetylase [Parvibaculum sp.]
MGRTDLDLATVSPLHGGGSASHETSKVQLGLVGDRFHSDQTATDLITQTTLASEVSLDGIGLHKGNLVRLVLKPAVADTGIVFRRTDLEGSADIPARFDSVCDTAMCTAIGNSSGASVATIEHLMAAVSAAGVDNLIVEIDAHEVPVMDGSSDAFVDALELAGTVELDAPRRYIRILAPISLEEGNKKAVLEPYDVGFRIEIGIDFENKIIGKQYLGVDITQATFRDQIADARTFGFYKDVELLRSLGLAKGASLDNAVVLDGETIMNEDGLRGPDEFVRHKILDAVGDLSLAGAPILGCYKGERVGHAFNNQMLVALFANREAWEYVTLPRTDEDELSSGFVPQLAVSAD